jgi:hypothetical protein
MSRDFQMMFAAGMHLVEGGKGSNLHSGYMEISSSHNMQNNSQFIHENVNKKKKHKIVVTWNKMF